MLFRAFSVYGEVFEFRKKNYRKAWKFIRRFTGYSRQEFTHLISIGD